MNFPFRFLYLALFACFAVNISAQSGRVKSSPTPTPTPPDRTSVGYVPTQVKTPPVEAKPPPTPEGDDIVKVDSTLVPIPLSVLVANGRSSSNLRAKDFELRIDGKVAEIGTHRELVRKKGIFAKLRKLQELGEVR